MTRTVVVFAPSAELLEIAFNDWHDFILVDDYEADALMVPKGCKFNHLHDEASCMSHDEWKGRAKAFCHREEMKLNEYGILLSCGTDMFTGMNFFGC